MILDAAERCYRRNGFARASVSDIAAEAGCSRSNVYRFFAGREGVFDAVAVRAVARRFPELQNAVASYTDAAEFMVEATVLTINTIREEPSMVEILQRARHGGEEPGSYTGEPVRQISRFWAEVLAQDLPQAMLDQVRDGVTPAMIGEHIFLTIIQVLFGITLIGESDDPDDVRWYVSNFVLPGVIGDKPVTPRRSTRVAAG